MNSKGNPIVGLIAVGIFSMILMAVSLHALYQDEEFEKYVLRSQGVVERSWTTFGNKGGIHYHVRYHYPDNLGHVWEVVNDTSQGTYGSVQMGTIVPVKYLAVDHGQSRIDLPDETQYHWHQDKVLFCVALMLGVVWAIILYSNLRRR